MFAHRQTVHIGAQGDDWTRFCALQGADHSRVGDAGFNLVEAECTKMGCHLLGGAEFTIGQFRMFVYVAAPGDDFGFHRRKSGIQLLACTLRKNTSRHESGDKCRDSFRDRCRDFR